MVRCGREGICPDRDHPGLGDLISYLLTREMSADTWFCTLSDLDLNHRTVVQVFAGYTEPAGCDLDYNIIYIWIQVFVDPAFTCVHKRS